MSGGWKSVRAHSHVDHCGGGAVSGGGQPPRRQRDVRCLSLCDKWEIVSCISSYGSPMLVIVFRGVEVQIHTNIGLLRAITVPLSTM